LGRAHCAVRLNGFSLVSFPTKYAQVVRWLERSSARGFHPLHRSPCDPGDGWFRQAGMAAWKNRPSAPKEQRSELLTTKPRGFSGQATASARRGLSRNSSWRFRPSFRQRATKGMSAIVLGENRRRKIVWSSIIFRRLAPSSTLRLKVPGHSAASREGAIEPAFESWGNNWTFALCPGRKDRVGQLSQWRSALTRQSENAVLAPGGFF